MSTIKFGDLSKKKQPKRLLAKVFTKKNHDRDSLAFCGCCFFVLQSGTYML